MARFLTLDQFAAQNPGLSMVTLRRLVQQRKLPSVQPGGPGTRLLIPEDALERMCAQAASSETGEAPDAPSDETITPKPHPGPRPRWRR